MTRTSLRSIGSRILGCAFLGVLATCDEARAPNALANGTAITPPAAVTVSAQGSGGITHTRLTSGNNAVNQKVYITAAILPAPNALVTVAVLSHRSTAAISPALSGGGMTTWSMVASVDFDAISLPHRRMTIFRAMSPAPGSGPITITFTSSVSNVQWIVSQWGGVDQSGVNGAGAIGQTGSNRSDAGNGLTVSLTPLGNATNVAYGVFGVKKNVAAVTPGTSFTEIDEQPSGESTASDLEAEWVTNDNTIDATWTTLSGGALGVEIKAGNTGPSVSPSLSTVTASPTSITASSGTSTITVLVKDTSGNPISGATVGLTATPVTGNTLTQPATPTDANGVATGTLSSAVAEPKTVSAIANGTAITQTATVTVTPAPVASVAVAPASASVPVNGTVQLTATPKDSSGNPLSGRVVTWSSSDGALATVDASGLVTGVGAGSATITATSEGKMGTAAVTVTSIPVATVAVSPVTASVEVGRTLQLTATLKDASGNPLTGRVVTWATNAWATAAVSASGLVTGIGAGGSATITATSEGKSGSATIMVIAPTPCLARAGPTITLSGVRLSAYSNTGLANNTKIDATTAQFFTPANKPVALGGGSQVCFSGGETIGRLPPATDWSTMHDTYAFQAKGIAGFALEGKQEFDYGDGITLDDSTTNWIIRGVHFKYMRDDCVQNDWLNSGLIEDSFFDGCYEGFSSRPFVITQDGSSNLVVVKNSLYRLQDMDQGYVSPGHGGFFKWSPTGPLVSLYNNVYRVDSRSNLGGHSLGPPAGKLKDCANNVMIWLGSGPFPETLPSCYTLLTGSAGLQYWNNAVANWKANHPSTLSDVGPPIVSMYSPAGSTALQGIVNLTATAVDDRDIAGVQFQVDGQNIGSEVTTESPITKFTLIWNSDTWPRGTHTLTATARDASGNTKTSSGITVTISNVSPSRSTVSVLPTTITASNGSIVSTITVTARDASGNPVSGAIVTLSATGSNTITQPNPTDVNGVTTGTLSSTVAGSKTVTAIADGGVILSQQPIVTVTAGAPDAATSTVNAVPGAIVVNSGTSAITATVKDAFGNPVSGSTVVLAASGTGNTLTQPAGPTNASGMTTGTLSSTVAETKTVSATAGGMSITQTATVLVTPPGFAATITHALLTSGGNAVNQSVSTTVSIAPAANRLVTVAVLDHRTPAAISPTLSGGGMTSWNVVATVDFDTIGGALRRLTIFRAMSAVPGSGPITISFTNSVSNVQWIVSQWDGVETSGVNGAGAIVQTGSNRTNAGNGLAVTLGAFGNANNVAYGVFGVNKNVVAITPGAGFTKIDEQPSGENTPGDLLAEWVVNHSTIDATWSNLRGGALGVEIKARTGP